MGSQKKSQAQRSPLPTLCLSILAASIRKSRAMTEEKKKGGERKRDRELEGPLRALGSQVTKLVQGVGFPSF